ncbi:TPA: S4 domain-containing protein [Klebsiella pneumoniae]
MELDGLATRHISSHDLSEALINSGLAASKRTARELLASDAIRVNGEKVTAEQNDLGFALFDQYWILQKGKKHFALLKR